MADESIALDDLPVPFLVVRDGAILAIGADLARRLAPGGAPLVGTPALDLFAPPDQPAVAEFLTSLGALGRPAPLTVRTRPPPGRLVVLDGRADDAGRLLIGWRDITAERRLSAIIDAVADSTLLIDPDGNLLWQSDALAARVPSGAAALGSHPVERLHPEDLPLAIEAFSELAHRPGQRLDKVVRSRAVDHDDVWQLIELVAASRVDDPDLGGVVVQVRNLNKGSELDSIGQTDGPMHSLAEAAPIGLMLTNRLQRVLYASTTSRRLLGFAETDDVTSWRDRVSVAQRADLDAVVYAVLAGGWPRTVTASFAIPGAASRWMRVRVAPHLDRRGDVIGAIVAIEDVTAEVDARMESERLLHMLDASSDYVVVFRPSGEILHTNAALREVLDRHRAAGGAGRLAELLVDRETVINEALEVLAGSDTWQGELRFNVTPDRTIPVSALAIVRRDESGELEWIAMVARDITDLKEGEARLRRLATSDNLTGLANRTLFTEHLELVVARAERVCHGVAVLFCDLDHFKAVNDELGHAAGDAVLVEIADRLRLITREGDMAARVGGDEFVILCEGLTQPNALEALATRVIETVTRAITIDDDVVEVGISIGIGVAADGGVDGDRLLVSADQAMYEAKAAGGNQYRIHHRGPTA